MSILDSVLTRLGYGKMQAIENLPAMLSATAEGQRYNVPPLVMPEAQSELYQRLSWVQVAVGAVAQAAAVERISVHQLEGEDEVDIPNHPLEMLLLRPNPLHSRFELLQATFAFLQLTGNAYWWLNRSRPNVPPAEIWTIPAHQLEPVPDGRMFIRGYWYEPGGGEPGMMLEPWQIVHFRRFHPLNWFVGLSPIEALATIAEGDLAMQRWNTQVFAKNNAKIPGALAFADPIEETEWNRMKTDIIREHGGTNRTLMLMRNTGSGVSWIPMAIPQKDMEFLAGRQFNKEEIFSIYAPGLASMLAINATEANSVAGKATFLEFAVWPQMVAVAEKITNDLLPAYGQNLVAGFDDVRQSDKAMELAEQNAFLQVHTIDEVRQKYYGADPIGDERGTLLVAEVKAASAAPSPAMAEAPTSAAVQIELPQAPELPEPELPDEEDEDEAAAKRRETKALKRYLRNRSRPDPAQFQAEHLSEAEVWAIAEQMGMKREEDGAADDAPFRYLDWAAYP